MVGSGSYERFACPTRACSFSIPGLLGRFQTEGPTVSSINKLEPAGEGKDLEG